MTDKIEDVSSIDLESIDFEATETNFTPEEVNAVRSRLSIPERFRLRNHPVWGFGGNMFWLEEEKHLNRNQEALNKHHRELLKSMGLTDDMIKDYGF